MITVIVRHERRFIPACAGNRPSGDEPNGEWIMVGAAVCSPHTRG